MGTRGQGWRPARSARRPSLAQRRASRRFLDNPPTLQKHAIASGKYSPRPSRASRARRRTWTWQPAPCGRACEKTRGGDWFGVRRASGGATRGARGGVPGANPRMSASRNNRTKKSAGTMETDSRAVTRDATHLEERDTLPTARVADMDMADMLREVLGVVERRETRATSGSDARHPEHFIGQQMKNLFARFSARRDDPTQLTRRLTRRFGDLDTKLRGRNASL